MQKLSENITEKLEAKGLKLFGKERTLVMICKPLTTVGNCIENKIFTPIHEMEVVNGELVSEKDPFRTDAPMLSILIEKDEYRVRVWQWVPGPGPGDFDIGVSTEEEAYQLTINYFFEKNEHFEAYRDREINGRK